MKLVMVRWVDSYTEYGWNDKACIEELAPTPPTTVGILAKETKDSITVIQTISLTQYTGSITIPKASIKQMWRLGVK